MIHVTTNKFPTLVGDNVTVGHSVTLHGVQLVTISWLVLDQLYWINLKIGEWSIVAAGSVLKPGTKIKPGKLCSGLPTKEIRDINDIERKWIKELSNNYISLSKEYLHS